MPRERRAVRLFRERSFSPIQTDVLRCPTRHVAFPAGRRVGKTEVSAAWLVTRLHRRMDRLAAEVRAGRRRPWPGRGQPQAVVRNLKPDVLAWVVAPQDAHLDEHRGNLLNLYLGTPGNEVFLHPSFPGGLYKRDTQLWLWHEAGVCARIDFYPASSERRMVSKGLDILVVDEAGFVENGLFRALKPTTYDKGGEILALGTPSLGDDHWFTRWCVAGLDEDHERYDPAIAKRDREITTYIADTVHHAYLREARVEALREIDFWGELWAAQWIWADWRLKVRNIYREWVEGRHVQELRQARYLELGSQVIREPPDRVYGVVDWSGGTSPGAVVIAYYWARHPIHREDPRPLVVAVEDYEGHEQYTDDGWWRILHRLDQRWGVDRWLGDPHSPSLIEAANKAGFAMAPGPHQDKMGRISLVSGLLHWTTAGVAPALYVAAGNCQNIPREMKGYRWRTNRAGEATGKPKDHDDHCLDCLAMLASEVATPGGFQVGADRYH